MGAGRQCHRQREMERAESVTERQWSPDSLISGRHRMTEQTLPGKDCQRLPGGRQNPTVVGGRRLTGYTQSQGVTDTAVAKLRKTKSILYRKHLKKKKKPIHSPLTTNKKPQFRYSHCLRGVLLCLVTIMTPTY